MKPYLFIVEYWQNNHKMDIKDKNIYDAHPMSYVYYPHIFTIISFI